MTRTTPMHLVTIAIEDTWPKNTSTPILFLGEWFKLYSRKLYWGNLESTVLAYHWDDRQKLFNDYNYLNDLYERLLKELSVTLNEIHNVAKTDEANLIINLYR